jgi:ParB/RepB/Spo0J family partition protein
VEDQVTSIPVDQLTEPWVLLRTVDKGSLEYLELRDSLAAAGFLNSIAVRPSTRVSGMYEIIDGMYRWTCARELGMQEVPCIVKHGISDNQVLSLQLQANAVRPETTPLELAKQLRRIQKARPEITLGELSQLIHKGPSWVGQILGLLRLRDEAQKAMDRGDISLGNAVMLAKIPPRFQLDYLDLAKIKPAAEFRRIAAGVVKQFMEAARLGKLEAFYTAPFQPRAHVRGLKELECELEDRLAGARVMMVENSQTLTDAWYAAIKWVLHLDHQSVQEQEAAVRKRSRQIASDDLPADDLI